MDNMEMNRDASDKMMALTLEQIKCYIEVLEDDESWKSKTITYLEKLQRILD